MKESTIQRQILDHLAARHVLAWRCSLGGVRLGNGRMARNSMAGFPDIAFVLEGGRFGAIEVKAEKGKLSAVQELWRDRLLTKNVLYVLARSVDDVDAAIRAALLAGPRSETGAAI